MKMDNKETFRFTYSSKEQIEIQNIRKKYVSAEKQEDKMAQLRRLDAGVYSKATVAALVVGMIGALVMGTGMSLVMTEIGAFLGTVMAMIVGIGLGVIGIILVCLAYPLYNRTLKKEREKIAPEILRLTDELMK
jgi:cbb3-type cytochrome oxidase subunit 3